MLAALLLVAVLLQHSEARAMKGPGLKGLHKGPLAKLREARSHKPRLADHMRAAGRMVYVVPQDYPGSAPEEQTPEEEYWVEPYTKGSAAVHAEKVTSSGAAASGKDKSFLPLIKVAAGGGVSHSKHMTKAKAAAPKAAPKSVAADEHKTERKYSAERRAAPAADAVAGPTGPSVEDQLQAIRDAPVQFLAPKPAAQPAQKVSTPTPVLQGTPAQQAAPEPVTKGPEAVGTHSDAVNSQAPQPTKVPAGQSFTDTKMPSAIQPLATHAGAAAKPAAVEHTESQQGELRIELCMA